MFETITGAPSVLVSDLAVDQILKLINDGRLPVGTRLPPERALAESLGVSRSTLREALRILGASGVLEARTGRGRVVTSRPSRGQPSGSMAAYLVEHREEVAEINHVLQLVTPAAFVEIPAHLLPEIAAGARDTLDAITAALDAGDTDRAAEGDILFHRQLIERTPNALLRGIAWELIGAAPDHGKEIYRISAAARHSMAQHSAIIAAVEHGQKDRAAQLIRDHAAIGYRFAIEQSLTPDSGDRPASATDK
jgi:DNA-binding FadR family transcriptional regulator